MQTNLEGRELDIRIAREVLGWSIHKQNEEHGWPPIPKHPHISARALENLQTVPRSSTDIKAAFEVVASVQKEHGWRFDLLGHEKGYWHAEFFGHPDPQQNSGQRWGDQYASSPALAICAAALQAVESWKLAANAD